MANQFVNLPVPAGNGVGASDDVSTFGASKSIVVGGDASAQITIEVNNDAGQAGGWAALKTFQGTGELVVNVACRWMRVRVSNYNSYAGGQATCDVGGTDDGTSFQALAATTGNGAAASSSTSALGEFKTVQCGGHYRGTTIVEVSEDGASWGQPFAFGSQSGGIKSLLVTADFMRVRRVGVPKIDPGIPVVTVGACVPGGGGGGGGGGDLGWYGTGVDGAHVTAGDESMTQDMFYTDLTITAGDTFSTAGYRLYVSGTLTIAPGGFLDNSGSPGVLFTGGAGAPTGSVLGGGDGGNGEFSHGSFDSPQPGVDTNFCPSRGAAFAGGKGGDSSFETGAAGGIGNRQVGFGTYMVGSMAIGDSIGGGPGGGGGCTEFNAFQNDDGGAGGGGGGVIVLCAKSIVCDANAIRCRGGDGATPNLGDASGGGGGCGGVVIIVTNDAVAPTVDVSGGAGGAPIGTGNPGVDGSDGVVIAISPAFGPL